MASVSRADVDKTKPIVWAAAISVIVLALVVRVIGLGSESAWIDEAYSITLARFPLTQIIQGTAADQHPPLYYFLLHFWMLFGNSVAFARLLSALLGTTNVFQVLQIGRMIGKAPLGIGAALLLAVSPFHIWYSQETRQYMLLAVLTTAATIELWNCLQGKRRWWLYGVFSILALYTQYFAVFIFLAHAIILAIWSMQQRTRRHILPWMATMLATVIAFIPWFPTAITQFVHHTMPWIGEPAAGDVRDVILRLIISNGVSLLPTAARWAAFAFLLAHSAFVSFIYIRKNQFIRTGFGFIAVWALVPFLLISLISIFYPIFQTKQYLLILAPLILFMAVICLASPRPWGALLFGGLFLVAGLSSAYQQSVLTKDDWRGAAVYIDDHQQPGDLVYGNPAASLLALNLYWDTPLPFEGYPPEYSILRGGWAGEPLTSESANVQMIKATLEHPRVWLIEFFPQFWDAQHYLASWLNAHGKMLDDQSFGSIHLRLYELTH